MFLLLSCTLRAKNSKTYCHFASLIRGMLYFAVHSVYAVSCLRREVPERLSRGVNGFANGNGSFYLNEDSRNRQEDDNLLLNAKEEIGGQ